MRTAAVVFAIVSCSSVIAQGPRLDETIGTSPLTSTAVLLGEAPPAASADGANPAAAGEGGAAKGNGTNPADLGNRLIFRNEYLALGNGTVINSTIGRCNFGLFGGKGQLGIEVPLNYYDPRIPNVGSVGGFGDVKIGLTGIFFTSESKALTLVGGSDFWIPSADNILLIQKPVSNTITVQDIGTGKYRAGPFMAAVYAFDKTFFIAPLYQHEFSFAGDGSRQPIHRGAFKLFMSKGFASGWYLLPETQIVIDYRNHGDLDVFIAPEVGYSRQGTTIYFKPGIGINPDDNNRAYGVNFGIRQSF